jgi:peroxiredoxin
MKHLRPALAFLSAIAFCTSPLLASSFDGQTGKKKDPPKKEAPKPKPPEPKKAEPKKPEPAAKPIAIGGELDGVLALEDAAGKAHAMKDYRGKIVVLAFWSSGSAADAQEKRLAKIATDFAGKNVIVLAVDAVAGEADNAKTVQEAATKSGVTFPVLLDKSGTLAERLGAKALDEVFVLDAKGLLRYSGSIDDDPKGEKADKAQDYLSAALKSVIDGKDATPTTTAPNGGALHAAEAKKAPAPPTGKK